MEVQWVIILYVFAGFCALLAVLLFIWRICIKYAYREIEDIIIYDRTQKAKVDYDSPAILNVFYED